MQLKVMMAVSGYKDREPDIVFRLAKWQATAL